GRTGAGLMPQFPHPDALQWHFNVADAIGGQDPDRAKEAMFKIVAKTDEEMGGGWADEPRHPGHREPGYRVRSGGLAHASSVTRVDSRGPGHASSVTRVDSRGPGHVGPVRRALRTD